MIKVQRGILVFVQSSGNPFWDFITRVASGSGVVHCGISLGDGTMINARGQGVCISNVIEGVELWGKLPNPDLIEPVISYMHAQLGKPYDYAHLIANPVWNIFHANIGCDAPNAWNCSTLLAAAIRNAMATIQDTARVFDVVNRFPENDPFGNRPLCKITPQDILNAFPQLSFQSVVIR